MPTNNYNQKPVKKPFSVIFSPAIGEEIVVAEDDTYERVLPKDKVVYRKSELVNITDKSGRRLTNADPSDVEMLRFIHEAKSIFGGVVMPQERTSAIVSPEESDAPKCQKCDTQLRNPTQITLPAFCPRCDCPPPGSYPIEYQEVVEAAFAGKLPKLYSNKDAPIVRMRPKPELGTAAKKKAKETVPQDVVEVLTDPGPRVLSIAREYPLMMQADSPSDQWRKEWAIETFRVVNEWYETIVKK